MTDTPPVPELGREPVPAPGHDAGPGRSHDAVTSVFRTALRDMLVLLGALAVLGIGLGYAVAGMPGVWGALIGIGLALLFSGTTVASMLLTARAPATTMAAVVMGAWLAKVVVLIAVLALIRDEDFYHRGVLAAVLFAGVIGSALLDYRAVRVGRVPYVTPSGDAATGGVREG
ncbi:hypothetical protein [Cellulomonas aerilata]|uniref:ATP synthase protein I n=1 Tax=Cellulomonas aerilata TaxID=515326 RepID=A0A512DEA4_9CELL|nr:hypothetical protein [Cellulomonas aerilata]GEO34803.1 hypothetical protein CAE01nite_25280 [Cellulomonas aerilata]